VELFVTRDQDAMELLNDPISGFSTPIDYYDFVHLARPLTVCYSAEKTTAPVVRLNAEKVS